MPLTSTPLLTHTLLSSFCFRCFLWLGRFIPGSITKKCTNTNNTCFLVKRTFMCYQSTFISRCFFYSSFQTEMIVLVRSDIAQLQQVSLSYSVSVSLFLSARHMQVSEAVSLACQSCSAPCLEWFILLPGSLTSCWKDWHRESQSRLGKSWCATKPSIIIRLKFSLICFSPTSNMFLLCCKRKDMRDK